MYKKLILIVLLISAVIGTALVVTAQPGKENNGNETIYRMDSKKGSLVIKENPNNTGKTPAPVKIYFNGKDYTPYVQPLLDKMNPAFTSGRLMIFGPKKITCVDNICICKKGTIFIPGDTEILIIQASKIRYDVDGDLVTGKKAVIKRIIPGVPGKERVEKRKRFSIALGDLN